MTNNDPAVTRKRIEGVDIQFRWESGSRYALVAKTADSGHVVSQHATHEDTHRKWVRLDKRHWIVSRTRDDYDELAAAYPDIVAG